MTVRAARWVALSILVASMVVASCAPATAQVSNKDVFKAAFTTNPVTLDAHMSTNTAVRQVAVYLYETLVTYGENYEIIPQLAQDWTVSPDGLTYTFNLRPGVKFHNGKVLTAQDVKASIDRYMQVSQGAERFSAVEAITVVDQDTLRFTLNRDVPLLVALAMPSPFLAIYPAEVIEKYGTDEIRGADVIGTGPYELIEWQPDVYVRLGRFEGYQPDERFEGATGFGGRRIGHFSEIQLIPVPEAASRIAGLLTGEFDFAEAVPITSYADLEANPNVEAMVVKPKWGIVLELNQGEPPMDDVRFRQALVYALDMENVLRAATFGQSDLYRVQPSIFFPEQTDFYSEAGSEAYAERDLEKVAQLLEEVGYNYEPLVFLSNRDYDWMYKASLAITAQWQEAGINVQLEFMDYPSQIDRATGLVGWHVNQSGWSPRFDPIQLVSSLHSKSVGAYNYQNPEMDRLLTEVNSGLPQAERAQIWEQAQRLVWEDVAVIRIGDYHEIEAVRANVEGFRPFYVTPRFWNVTK